MGGNIGFFYRPRTRFQLELVRHGPSVLQSSRSLIVHSFIPSSQVQTLRSAYLIKRRGVVVERPQFMWLRVAITIHPTDLSAIKETYDALSHGLYIHGSPVLYRAGTTSTGFASCILYAPDPMSSETLVQSMFDLNEYWSNDGGVGLGLSTIPARRSVIFACSNGLC